MQGYAYVILGGGVAAGYAAQAFANSDAYRDGDLAIISDEDVLPYDRPPLSKSFLEGEAQTQDVRINNPMFYRENGIDVYLNTHISQIDPDENMLYTDAGDGFAYGKLLLTPGSSVNTLDVEGEDLDGVFYLRDAGQSAAIHQRADDAETVAIIGGGYIGMEVAAVMSEMGKEVTMIFPEDRLMAHHFFTPEMSDYFENYYAEHGVEFIPNARVKAFSGGGDGSVQAVNLVSSGTVAADLVIAGTGVTPNTDELAQGIRINRTDDGGFEVDSMLRTNVADIYAAGDAANYPDILYGKRRRVEHWDNAKSQGEYWASLMLGETDEPFKMIPYFFSDMFDLSYEFWGDAGEADAAHYRGDFDEDSFSVWWTNDDILMAAFVMDRPDEERTMAQEWIRSGNEIDPALIADDTSPIYVAE